MRQMCCSLPNNRLALHVTIKPRRDAFVTAAEVRVYEGEVVGDRRLSLDEMYEARCEQRVSEAGWFARRQRACHLSQTA